MCYDKYVMKRMKRLTKGNELLLARWLYYEKNILSCNKTFTTQCEIVESWGRFVFFMCMRNCSCGVGNATYIV
ncbi:hypothetical protein CACET_c01880 [Clostridium aceticum]|uniref:Uncharacterized protein n=1 Tax=Clostridium aceticum TaxID=84022 RepID=A0A0G3W8D3_9CLOT|nr:hypothetical protein CACET_c01880 [Clostridium aceticum]